VESRYCSASFPATSAVLDTENGKLLLPEAKMPTCLLRRTGIFTFDPASPAKFTLGQSQNCDLFGKQNGFVDRLRHLMAQIFTSHVVGAEMLPSVNPAQSRLLRRR
jgi:hypothetical protein